MLGSSSAQQRGWRDRSEVSAQKFCSALLSWPTWGGGAIPHSDAKQESRSQASNKLMESVWHQFRRISHWQTANIPIFRLAGTLVHLECTEVLLFPNGGVQPLPQNSGWLVNPVTITCLSRTVKRQAITFQNTFLVVADLGPRRGIAQFFRWIFLRLCLEG